MVIRRIFYVTQGSLSVWEMRERRLECTVRFTDDDTGLRDFDVYLASRPDESSIMLLDVIEEEFACEPVPKLGARDRAALIANRSKRKFSRTPYRVSVFTRESARSKEDGSAVYSAISNHELVDPWLQAILHHRVPLAGVYSVAMMARRILSKLFPSVKSALFIAPHQGSKLRFVFLRNGCLKSARLSHSPGTRDQSYASFVVKEATRSRQYLARRRLLSNLETLDICVVADEATAAQIAALTEADSATRFSFIDPHNAVRKLGGGSLSAADHFEEAYFPAVIRQLPKHSYASSGENRYWVMQRLRSVLLGTAVTTAAVCSIAAAVFLSNAWLLKSQVTEIQSQVTQLSETFRRENDSFTPLRADSNEMQLAVDTGEFLLHNRLPVPWVMNQLGAVMGHYPDIQIQELRWLAGVPPAAQGTVARRASDEPQPVNVVAMTTVDALVSAKIIAFDGDMRRAFARIDELVADLESMTHFQQVIAVEYPFDASTSAAISGSLVGQKTLGSAQFQVRLTYEVPTTAVSGEENSDESI